MDRSDYEFQRTHYGYSIDEFYSDTEERAESSYDYEDRLEQAERDQEA